MAVANQRSTAYDPYDAARYVLQQPPSPNRTSASGVNTLMPTTSTPTMSTRFDTAGSALTGAAGGSANERDRQMLALRQANQEAMQKYGINQNATLDALLAAGRDRMGGYQTRQGATTDAAQGLQQAQTAARQGMSNEKIALAKLGLEAPTANARASILGSLMKNMQPSRFDSPAGQQGHLTKFSGGMTAANLDPMTRQHGEELMRAALEKQLSGGGLPEGTDFLGGIQDWKSSVLDVPEATDYSKGVLLPPELQDTYKKPGTLESILGVLGTGAKLAGAFF